MRHFPIQRGCDCLFDYRSAPPTFTWCFALLLSLPVARHSQSAADPTLPLTPANHAPPETATVPLSCLRLCTLPAPVNGGMRWSDACRIIVRLSIDAGGKVRRVPHWLWPRVPIGRSQTRRALDAFQKTRTGAYGSCQVGLSNDDLPARPLRQPLQGLSLCRLILVLLTATYPDAGKLQWKKSGDCNIHICRWRRSADPNRHLIWQNALRPSAELYRVQSRVGMLNTLLLRSSTIYRRVKLFARTHRNWPHATPARSAR